MATTTAVLTAQDAADRGNPNDLPDLLHDLHVGSFLRAFTREVTETITTAVGDTGTLTYTPIPGTLRVAANSVAKIENPLTTGAPGAGAFRHSGKTLVMHTGEGHATTQTKYLTLDQVGTARTAAFAEADLTAAWPPAA